MVWGCLLMACLGSWNLPALQMPVSSLVLSSVWAPT